MIFMLNLILGLLMGLALGYLFSQRFRYNWHGPDSNDVQGNIYQDQENADVCYTYQPVPYICPLI